MSRIPRHARALALLASLVALLAVALPVVGADPSPSPEPPGRSKPDKAAKADKGPEIARTLSGTVRKGTDAQGRPTFTMTVDGTVWELSAGPRWFHGDANPLEAWVGKSVEVAGTYHEGATELDVATVDGKAIRAAGRPPWAGGPWTVGDAHPGWKAWRADGKPGNGKGREGAPGQLRDKAADDEADAGG